MEKDFLPVLINDFSKQIVVKFSGGKMSEEDIEKLKMFMEMVGQSNLKQVVGDLLKEVEGLKINNWNDEFKERLEAIRKVIEDEHKWIVSRLELHVRSVIGDYMFKETVESPDICLSNFT